MAITIVMKDQKKFTETKGRTVYAHINPETGKLDAWGLAVSECPVVEEGGVA